MAIGLILIYFILTLKSSLHVYTLTKSIGFHLKWFSVVGIFISLQQKVVTKPQEHSKTYLDNSNTYLVQ